MITDTNIEIESIAENKADFTLINFSSFMRANNLTHMIRSNESLPVGYRLQYGSRIVTISSAIVPVVANVDSTSGMPSIRIACVKLNQTLI